MLQYGKESIPWGNPSTSFNVYKTWCKCSLYNMKENVYNQYRAHFRFQMVWRAESANIVYKQDIFVIPWYKLRPGVTRNPLSMFMKLGINNLYIMQNKTYTVNIGLTSGFRWYGELNTPIWQTKYPLV